MFRIEDGRSSFWQWDLNQRLIVGENLCDEVHFCNSSIDLPLSCKVYKDGVQNVVDVPNVLLQSAKNIRVYAYVTDRDQKHTKRETWFAVNPRPKPADYIYTETELYTVEEMMEEALQAAKESGDFDGDPGYTPQKGIDYFTPEDREEMISDVVDEIGEIGVGRSVGNHAEIFNDYENNQALSPYSSASGKNTVAGILGYYYYNVDVGNKKIYLTDTQGVENPDTVVNYAVGDKLSLVYGSKYPNCSTIKEINGNTVTVDALPIVDFALDTSDMGDDDYSLYVINKPLAGLVPLGYYATAEGLNAKAIERVAHAEGRDTLAYGQYGHAEGRGTQAFYAAHAEGYMTDAPGFYAHAEGNTSKASGESSHAEGCCSQSAGLASHAEGRQTQATAETAHAEGLYAKATGGGSHAEGYNTTASGPYSHAEGYTTEASGDNSHAEGSHTQATALDSHAEGFGTRATKAYAHAEGYQTYSRGEASHAEGSDTHAEGDRSHAEGNNTYANGSDSHAEGIRAYANAEGAHAEGYYTNAQGKYSHAEGNNTSAYGEAQHVEGKYNKIDGSLAHILGNGTDNSNRSNAHTVDWEGNGWFAGDIKIGGTSYKDENAKVVATRQYVDEAIANLLRTLRGE